VSTNRAMRAVEPLIGIASVVVAWEIASRVAANSTLVPPPASCMRRLA